MAALVECRRTRVFMHSSHCKAEARPGRAAVAGRSSAPEKVRGGLPGKSAAEGPATSSRGWGRVQLALRLFPLSLVNRNGMC